MRTILRKEDLTPGEIAMRADHSHLRVQSNIDGYKRFTLAVIGYIVITFVIAAGWHLVLFKYLYDQLGIFSRKEPIIPLGIISMVMQGLVLAYLYPLIFRGESILKEGLKFGLLIGVLMASIAVFAKAAKQQVSSLTTWLVFESGYYLLQFSVVGVVIASIYGRRLNSQ